MNLLDRPRVGTGDTIDKQDGPYGQGSVGVLREGGEEVLKRVHDRGVPWVKLSRLRK